MMNLFENLQLMKEANEMSNMSPDEFYDKVESGEFRNATHIDIPEGVTEIDDRAFKKYNSLTSVTIPDSVTTIGYSAFYGCTGLTSVTIPDSVTTIEGWAFENCNSLTSVTIPDSVTTIGDSVFAGCKNLAKVNITDIGAWCNIAFTSYQANPLYYGGKLYLNGSPVTQLTIPDSVTTIGNYAFSGCSGITSITIPDSVTTIGDAAFRGCKNLAKVIIPNGIKTIDKYAFAECDNLKFILCDDKKFNNLKDFEKYIRSKKGNNKNDINDDIATAIENVLYGWYNSDEDNEGDREWYYWDYAYDTCKNAPNNDGDGIIDNLHGQVCDELEIDDITEYIDWEEFLKLIQTTVKSMNVGYLYTYQKRYGRDDDDEYDEDYDDE